MCYNVHMETINIRMLHMKTGEFIRKAATGKTIVVTDRGNPVAALTPYQYEEKGSAFESRETIPAFDELPEINIDSSEYVSEDRDRG
jgi:prevent-host-death family protein